jgi:NAD(P)-dependent dehydrogenase (short-subunit alcohol dehydrogenase family)
MQVLVIGGTEFISLHLVRALLRDGHHVAVLNRGRNPARLPAGVRAIACDRLDHAALRKTLAGERCDALVDITYAPTTGADVEALLDALDGRMGHVMFAPTGRVHDHALPTPTTRTRRAISTGVTTRRTRSRARTSCRAAGEHRLPVTIVRDARVRAAQHTEQRDVLRPPVRNRPILVPGAGSWLRQLVTSKIWPTRCRDARRARGIRPAYNVTGEEARHRSASST